MKLFDVYPLFDVNIVKGQGCKVWDDKGQEYLDLYGGHAVISIGHAHPHYIEKITEQVSRLGFYSNSVVNKLQVELAERLGRISGYDDYQLFLINSGAEANENALKLASFTNGRTRVLSAEKAFHGRTSLAVEVTNNPKIIAPINDNGLCRHPGVHSGCGRHQARHQGVCPGFGSSLQEVWHDPDLRRDPVRLRAQR